MSTMERLRQGRALAVLGGFVATYAVLFAVVYYVTVRTVPGRQLGDAALRGAQSATGNAEDTLVGVLNVVSVGSLLGAVAVVAMIALVRLARVPGLAATGILVGANGTTWLLKEVLLSRPDLSLVEVSPATLNSLPSGHTTAVFSAVAALVFVLPHRLRMPAALAGGAYAALTALATMGAGWHRAGDSVAAILVVGLWTTLAAAFVIATGTAPRVAPPDERYAAVRWLVVTVVGALVVGLTLAFGLNASDSVRESTIGEWAAFFAGFVFVVGAVAGTLAGIVTALRVMEAEQPA